MLQEISELQRARAGYIPRLPPALRSRRVTLQPGRPTQSEADQDAIRTLFPLTYGQPLVTLGENGTPLPSRPMRVGAVLSGGQAPGGHNVIVGLLDAIQEVDAGSVLYGFLRGPRGVIRGDYKELTPEAVREYRNTGGFDLIMSGRDKIEKPEDLAACERNLRELQLDGLVIIGGDDSNTNAAVLAEYLKSRGANISVIGAPKTIDGDMKSEHIETSFGFHTATRVYAEMIGNIARDAMSAVKYWHFIRLMGRAASHVTLECALLTHPNVTLISEEIQQAGTRWNEIVDEIVDVVVKRAKAGRNYGVALIPEGLVEFCSDFRPMLDELGTLLAEIEDELKSRPGERLSVVSQRLSAESRRVFDSLPIPTREVLLRRDSHGNLLLSQVETERILADTVEHRLVERQAGGEPPVLFSPLTHFFGYEGRCAVPSNFDADYTYSLGFAAAHLIRGQLTGYTVFVSNLTRPHSEWVAGGVPVTMMLNMETRRGRSVPVIRKALVDLQGKPFQQFARERGQWAEEDCYRFPGPVQYFGPSAIADQPPVTLTLERGE